MRGGKPTSGRSQTITRFKDAAAGPVVTSSAPANKSGFQHGNASDLHCPQNGKIHSNVPIIYGSLLIFVPWNVDASSLFERSNVALVMSRS